MDMLSAIHQRFSVRSYRDDAVEPGLRNRVMNAASRAPSLTDTPPRVELISGVENVNQVLTFMIGSYGLIQNAPHLLAGIVPEDSELARIDLGYVLEHVVLEATRLGLGTCWITGTFDAERAGNVLNLAPGETVAAVCALGHPTEEGLGRFHSKLVRRLAGGHKRKPLTDLVHDQRWGETWSPDDADPPLMTVLKHARLAPSAHNGQPWRFIVKSGGILLTVVKPSFIDAGIVMSHCSIAAAAADYSGKWTPALRDPALADEAQLPEKAIPIGIFRMDD
jgi:nitroreductase